MLILVENLQVHLLSNCAYYPDAKPGKKHALNKQYALNSKLRLLTRVYGMLCTLVCGAHITLPQSKKKAPATSFFALLQTIISVKNLNYLVVVYHRAVSKEGGHDHVTAAAFQGQAKQCSKIPSTFSSCSCCCYCQIY